MPPIVFLASSIKNRALVDAVARQLNHCATPRVWMDDQAAIGSYILDWVAARARESDFGVFIFAPDERWGNQVNGNVLLEVGVFVACLGLDRCLIMTARGMELPSDLKGILTAEYDPAAFASQGDGALDSAIAAIADAIATRRSLSQLICGLWMEEKDRFRSEGSLSLVEFYILRGELKVRGRSYDSRGEETLMWPDTVDYSHVREERREVWHTFDARFGRFGRNVAVGVTCFSFDSNYKTGSGHFVVSGEGRIQQGLIAFTLRRITPATATGAAGESEELSIDNKEGCRSFIQEFLARRFDSRDQPKPISS